MARRLCVAVSIVAFLALGAPPAVAGGYCRGVPVTDATGTTVEMKGACFFPTVLRIRPGQAVTWVNRDSLHHIVAGANAAWGDYKELAQDDEIRFTFDTPGVYPYFCFLHIGMIGAVVVGDGSGPGAASPGGPAPVLQAHQEGLWDASRSTIDRISPAIRASAPASGTSGVAPWAAALLGLILGLAIGSVAFRRSRARTA